MDYLEADVARSQMFTSDVIKARMCTSSVSNVIYHKFSHGAAFYTLNGKNVNVMLEYAVIFRGPKLQKEMTEYVKK